MMKNWFWVLLLCTSSFSLMATPKDEINLLLNQQEVDWNNGDIQAYLQGYWQDDKLTFVAKGKFNHGWANLFKSYLRSYPDVASMGKLDFHHLDIKVLSDDAALVSGRWELKRAKDNPKGVFTVLVQRINDRWLITHDHSTD
jgi:ketosteroid isomerase-like protein